MFDSFILWAEVAFALLLATCGLVWLGRFVWALRAPGGDTVRLIEAPPAAPELPGRGPRPFVSVHLPIHAEPPEVVVETLAALAALDYPAYEVLVLDNNTADPRLWRPVERAARRHGFRFEHVDGVRGYKAGALELCLAWSDPRAELVFVVDADYQVTPDALAAAVDRLLDEDPAFVQLPQCYRQVPDGARVLEDELGTFFSHVLAPSAEAGAMLPTGTLCLLRRDRLEAAGGWPTSAVTEDARLGVRFLAAGVRGAYVHRCGGTGRMPHDLDSLSTQRRRWVAGNLQTLAALVARVGRGRLRLTGRQLAAALVQLTHWLPLGAPAAIVLALTAPGDEAFGGLAGLAAVGAAAELVLTLSYHQLVLARRSPGRRLGAAAVHLALGRTSAVAAVTAFTAAGRRFARTSKFADRIRGRGGAGVALAVVFLAAAAAHAVAGRPWVAVATAAVALVATLEPWLAWRLAEAAPAAMAEPREAAPLTTPENRRIA